MGLPLEVVIAGAGHRGAGVFASYAARHPERMRVVAVAEPQRERRERLAERHQIPAERSFEDWQELFAGPQLSAAAIVATRDDLHRAPALAALRSGYHVLLEKPMALGPEECHELVETAEAAGRILAVAHVLRYAPFYRQVYRIAREQGRLGEIQAISMAEHVAHWHFTHSYVRGKWQTTRSAAPLILAKCCHDLDLMAWIAGRPCTRVASLGALVHYRPENAPAGATARCTDGCPAEPDCLHSAPRFYARDRKGWPWSDVTPRPDAAARLEALRTGPYGLCAYRAGNDVVDRQTAILEFEGGLLGSFLVEGFASRPERTLRIQGTAGELVGSFEGGWLELRPTGRGETEKLEIGASPLGHGGGDEGLLDHFTDIASRDALDEAATSGRSALESHLIGFAAERARVEGRLVEVGELRR